MGQTLLIVLVMLALAHTVRAQCSPGFLEGDLSPGLHWTGGLAGSVQCSTQWDPDGAGPLAPLLIMGGSITKVGNTPTKGLMTFDGAHWGPMTFAFNSTVSAVHSWNNQLVAAGTNWTRAWDGSNWTSLAGLSGTVQQFVTYDTRLIAFINSAPLCRSWDGSAWQPLGPELTGGLFKTAIAYGNDLVIGGNNLRISHPTEFYSALRWNGLAWTPMGQTSGFGMSRINHLVDFNGELIAGGLGRGGLLNVARWDGTGWQQLGPGLPAEITSLTVHNGELLAACSLYAGRSSATYRWTGSDWLRMDSPTDLNALATSGSLLISYGAHLFSAGAVRPETGEFARSYQGVLRWDGAAWKAIMPGPTWAIHSLIPYQQGVVAVGEFLSIGGVPARRVAMFDGATWSPLGGGIGDASRQATSGSSAVGGGVVFRGDLVVNGDFYDAGGTPARYLAAWNGSAWRSLPGGPLGGCELIVFNDELLGYGNFLTLENGTPSRYLARFDGTQWRPFTVPPPRNIRYAIVFNGQLFCASDISNENLGIARWDGAAWSGIGATFAPIVMAEYNGELVAGLEFSSPAFTYIARWDGTTWRGLGAGLNGKVTGLGVFEGELYATGTFTASGSLTNLNGAARWNGSTWSSCAGGFTGSAYSDGAISAILSINVAPLNGELLVAHGWQNAGAAHSPYFARWSNHGRPAIARQPVDLTLNLGDQAVLRVQPSPGYEGTTVAWRRNDVPVMDGPTGHGSTISGATTNELLIQQVQGPDVAQYTAILTNACGSTTSMPATLMIPGTCSSADFNNDSDFGTDADIEAFFACLAGNCCQTCWHLGSDFNADGDSGTDADIEAFFRVLAGGRC